MTSLIGIAKLAATANSTIWSPSPTTSQALKAGPDKKPRKVRAMVIIEKILILLTIKSSADSVLGTVL
jgi:hypothetical protein